MWESDASGLALDTESRRLPLLEVSQANLQLLIGAEDVFAAHLVTSWASKASSPWNRQHQLGQLLSLSGQHSLIVSLCLLKTGGCLCRIGFNPFAQLFPLVQSQNLTIDIVASSKISRYLVLHIIFLRRNFLCVGGKTTQYSWQSFSCIGRNITRLYL